jgi:hypothetical protein
MEENLDTLEKLVKKAIWEGKGFLETFFSVTRNGDESITMSDVAEVYNNFYAQINKGGIANGNC